MNYKKARYKLNKYACKFFSSTYLPPPLSNWDTLLINIIWLGCWPVLRLKRVDLYRSWFGGFHTSRRLVKTDGILKEAYKYSFISVILQMRVYALYERSRKILVLLVLLFSITITAEVLLFTGHLCTCQLWNKQDNLIWYPPFFFFIFSEMWCQINS